MIQCSLADIQPAHIQALITGRVEEGPTIEFKRDLPDDTRDAKKEFVADVCALANSRGGDLIFGVDEDADGRASAVCAIPLNPDDAILRLTNILGDGLEPRLHGIEMQAVEMEPGNYVIVLRVPRSTSGVHRGTADRQFWLRESRSKRPLDVPAIANRFRDLFAREDRVADFFARRYAAVGSSYPLRLTAGPKVVAHFIPVRDFLYGEEVNIEAVTGPGQFPVLTAPMGMDSSMTFEGVLHFSNVVDGAIRAATLVFRNGVVESVCAASRRDAPDTEPVSLETIENYVVRFVRDAAPKAALLNGGYPVLLRVALVSASPLVATSTNPHIGQEFEDTTRAMYRGVLLVLPELLIADEPESVPMLLKPTFDRLWQAWGYPRSFSYRTGNGVNTWQGARV